MVRTMQDHYGRLSVDEILAEQDRCLPGGPLGSLAPLASVESLMRLELLLPEIAAGIADGRLRAPDLLQAISNEPLVAL